MSTIDLAYGNTVITFSYDETEFQILTEPTHTGRPLTDAEIGERLDNPLFSPKFEELLCEGDSVLIVVSDATRATGSAQIVHLLIRRMIQAGVSSKDIAIIFATGIHRPVSYNEKAQLLTPFVVQRIRTIDHDANDSAGLFSLMLDGAEVQLNRALCEFKHIVVTGGINFHYFAGFTGGRKSICPGLAGAETIQRTHMLAFDFANGTRRWGVGTGLLTGNAVNQACQEIAQLVNISFSINTVVDERGRVLRMYPGHWREAHAVACADYLNDHSIAIPQRRAVVITSCGGSPYDLNLIQAHKTLEMAARACVEGGTIVLCAACDDGLGRNDFLKWFDTKDSHSLAQRLGNEYEVNGQTAWALLTKTERFRVFLVSNLPRDWVLRMNMIPVESIDAALKQCETGLTGYLLPRGSVLLPLVSGELLTE